MVLGHDSVNGRMRVPRPPARMTHWRPDTTLASRQDRRTVVIETEGQFRKAVSAHGAAKTQRVLGVEQQEATAARADELAADGAVLKRMRITAIDAIVAHASRAGAFVRPVLIQQLPVATRAAFLQLVARRQAELFRKVEILDHLLVALERALFLIVQHLGGVANITGEEHHEVRFEVRQRVIGNGETLKRHRAVVVEIESGNTADRGDVLILLADGLLQCLDFNVTRLGGDFGRRNMLALIGVHGAKESDSERPRRPKTGARRNIRHAGDLDGPLAVMPPQRFAEDWMPDLIDALTLFEFRVFQYVPGGEHAVNSDVDVLGDGSGDDKAAKLFVVGRQVSASAADGDA